VVFIIKKTGHFWKTGTTHFLNSLLFQLKTLYQLFPASNMESLLILTQVIDQFWNTGTNQLLKKYLMDLIFRNPQNKVLHGKVFFPEFQ